MRRNELDELQGDGEDGKVSGWVYWDRKEA